MPVLVNHDHKFIFMHVTKTGGTSVWIKIMEEHPETQIISRGGKLVSMEDVDLTKGKDSRITQHSSVVPHLAPVRIRKILKPEVYDNYFKFGFVRNPYEWITSLFLYRRRTLGSRIPLPRLNGSSKTQYLTDNVYLDKNILDHVTKMLARDINLYETLSGKKAIDGIRTS